AVGASITSAVGQPGEVDVYSFVATAGHRILVDSGLSTSHSLRFHLISPTGTYLLNNSDINNDSGLLGLGESGTYQIVVYGDTVTIGNYSLRVVDVSTPPFLSANTQVADQLNPGLSTNSFRYVAQAGEHLYFDALGGSNAGTWQLIGPDNQTV